MNEAEKLTKGSVHEDDLYIVQDALVLMAAKETIKWMKQKGCLHHSPEFMPLDNSLNSLNIDILKSLRFHCVLSLSIIYRKEITEEERKLCFGSQHRGKSPKD